MNLTYPQAGFHFLVTFELFPQVPQDVSFQEVSGLSVEMGMESYSEGGENRFVHQLPTRTRYSDITLKRGLFLLSGVQEWCRQAFENYNFKPVNVMISLLNEDHLPLTSWYVINAIPKRLELSAFNAERSEIVIETLVLSYQYYKSYSVGALVGEFSASLTASASISF